MFFISRGTVRVYVAPDTNMNTFTHTEEKYVISLSDGSFFGEVALLKEVRAQTTAANLPVLNNSSRCRQAPFYTRVLVYRFDLRGRSWFKQG